MKKILSLALVCIMMFSALALTSCDDIMGMVESFIKNQGQITDDSKNVRTTITKEEWMDNWTSKNYTLQLDSDYMKMNVVATENAIKVSQDEISEICAIIDDVIYSIEKIDGVWLASPYNFEWPEMALIQVVEVVDPEIMFENLTYDETTKLYSAYDAETNSSMSFRFEDGLMVDGIINIPGYIYIHITNVGKTTLELPEFNFA